MGHVYEHLFTHFTLVYVLIIVKMNSELLLRFAVSVAFLYLTVSANEDKLRSIGGGYCEDDDDCPYGWLCATDISTCLKGLENGATEYYYCEEDDDCPYGWLCMKDIFTCLKGLPKRSISGDYCEDDDDCPYGFLCATDISTCLKGLENEKKSIGMRTSLNDLLQKLMDAIMKQLGGYCEDDDDCPYGFLCATDISTCLKGLD